MPLTSRARGTARGWTALGLAGLLTLAPQAMGTTQARTNDPAPLPYFASLKRTTTNVRVGPGLDYPIVWVFTRPALPVEVMNRYGNWRRIRDSGGELGWVHGAMLSSRRTALVQARGGRNVALRTGPDAAAPIRALLEPEVLVTPLACRTSWCRVEVKGHGVAGYMPQARLWGVYPDEIL
ncbi:SH3 domain-containing protein [Ancylobacter sp. 6x-1]|uniref:SH3 domain-containing protein n=1 Tax=Ancylobacter crimeensis TaxID=2579147 RepID=A0ABT0D934_9HYPH|nr:SH3 domain-containing protein [Ancylobacter crimeensis]MCK0196469.1 SH3 domain-containing protein [Ancylobacter crimeensis]